MKKLLLGFTSILFLNIAFSQSVTYTQVTGNYYASHVDNGPANAFVSSGGIQMNTNAGINSDVVAWRKFNTTGGTVTANNRPLQLGDKFSITLNASRAKGEIGIAFLSSPSSTSTFADRTNNFAAAINLDGADNAGSTSSNWYVLSAGNAVTSAPFGSNLFAAGTVDFRIDFTLVAADRANITITQITGPANTYTFYDVQLANSGPITDYSIYLQDAQDGSGTTTPRPIQWKVPSALTNTGSISLGTSNSTFAISAINNGLASNSNTTVSPNNFTKAGTGEITINAASSYTGSTTLSAGTITMGASNALATSPAKVYNFNGGTLKTGATTGFSLGSATTTAGPIQLNANSNITLGTGDHSLFFAPSENQSWDGSSVLTINNWVGTVGAGANSTSGKIFVGNSDAGGFLTAQELQQINFTGYGLGAQYLPGGSGQITPVFDLAPTTTASGITFTNIGFTSMDVTFHPGNGIGGRIVIATPNGSAGVAPTNGTAYTADPTGNAGTGSTGSPLGNGVVVFQSTGAATSTSTQTFTATNLTRGVTYYFDVYEYNGSGTSISYGNVAEASQSTLGTYTSIANGLYETPSNWKCNCVPPANSPVTINSNITLGADHTVSDVTVNPSFNLDLSTFTLTVQSSATNNGTISGTGAGEVKFLGTSDLAISGSGIYSNVESAITTAGNLVLNSDVTIGGNLIISSDAVSIATNTLTLNGAISGSGTIIGSPTSSLTIGGAAGTINFNTATASNRSLSNLTLNNTASSLIFGSNVDLYGIVTSTNNSVIDFNSKIVTLKSTATSNAIIGPVSVAGTNIINATSVIAERYIPGDRRAYRTISSGGVDAPGTIQDNWQEGQMNTVVGVNVNNTPGFGTQITGTGGNANGFDVTQTNSPSLYTFDVINNAYSAVPSTLVAGVLTANNPYLMYIRGDRSIDVTSQASPLPTSSTTLRVTGSLVTGDQDITNLLVGNPDGSAGNGYNLIANPFAAYLDFDAISADYPAIAFNYTYVDPTIGAQGGYVTYNTLGTVTPTVTHSVTNFIQPGQSFFIQFYNGNPGAIGVPAPFKIKESYKSTTGLNPSVFKAQTAQQLFRADIFFNNAGTRRVADGVAVLYDNKYSLNVDKYDAAERALYEHIAIVRNNVKLQIEARPLLASHDTLNLYLSGMNTKTKNYELQLNAINFSQPGMQAELVDNFTNTRTPVSLTGITNYPFVVTTDNNSTHSRFYVVFSPLAPLPVTLTSVKAYRQNTGVQVEWNLSQESNVNKYEIERSANSTSFVSIGSELSKGNSSNAVKYNFFDATPISGDNYYRIKAIDKNGSVTYSQVVSVNFGSIVANVSVYPNPVVNNNINIHIDNFVKGTYPVTITNQLGQIVYSKELVHPGGSTIETIKFKNTLRAGIYELKVGTYSIKILKQ